MQKIKIVNWYIIVTKNNIIILRLWQQTSNFSRVIKISPLQIGDCIFYNKNYITKDEFKKRLVHWPDFDYNYKKVTLPWFKKIILKQKQK